MKRKKPVAIFDIDGTVFRSSLLVELIEALIIAGIFPREVKKHYMDAWRRWQSRTGNTKTGFAYYEFINGVVFAYLKHLPGIRRADVWRVAEKVVEVHRARVYRYTRDLVKKLKKTHYLLAISHSPYEVVAPFAKSFGFDKVYAMVYEVDREVRFTGRVLYEDTIRRKDKVVRRAARKGDFLMKDSVGVGDTESDIAFLKLVDRPIAFNPSMKLYKHAMKKGWEVVVERKDVIYQLRGREPGS